MIWTKSAVLLRVSSLTKVEVRNFPLLHYSRWVCFVDGQLAMSLRRVKRSVICKFHCLSLQYSIRVISVLSTTFSVTEIFPLKESIAMSLFAIFTKMLKALQFFIFVAFGERPLKMFVVDVNRLMSPRRHFWVYFLKCFSISFFSYLL